VTRSRAARRSRDEHDATGRTAHVLSEVGRLEGALFAPEILDRLGDGLGAGMGDELGGL
jgi:hypothetical protein